MPKLCEGKQSYTRVRNQQYNTVVNTVSFRKLLELKGMKYRPVLPQAQPTFLILINRKECVTLPSNLYRSKFGKTDEQI